MRAAVLAATLLTLAAASPPAHAGGAGIFVPPVEIDMGVGATIGSSSAVVGPTEDLLAGLHWASLAWKPTPIDIGIGYVGSARQVVPGYSARTVDTTPFDNQLRLDGGYLELGKTLQGSSRHWRTWLSARGELLHGSVNDRSFSAIGGAVRVSSEVYLSGAAGGRNAIICGTLALGIYVEASHRDIAPELGPNGVTSGVSIRLPFILAGS